jgi:hypothetical protein
MPVEIEVTTGNRKVGGYGKFFAGTHAEEGTVISDAEAEV